MKFIRSKIDYIKNRVVLYYEKDGKIVKKYQSFNKLAPFTEKKRYDDYFKHILSDDDLISDSKIYDKIYKKKFKYDMNWENMYID